MTEIIAMVLWIALSFVSGSIMFCQILPAVFCQKDLYAISPDHNSGAANVFTFCGIPLGILCLTLELLKGFFPVYFAYCLFGQQHLLFALILVAPILGHAIAPFQHFHGGKCIAVSFGALLGLFPFSRVVLILAALYIFFSTVVKIYPIRIRSIWTFSLFGLCSFVLLLHEYYVATACGCLLISAVAIVKHLRPFAVVQEEVQQTEPYKC